MTMRYNAYPKEKIEKGTQVQVDHSNLTQSRFLSLLIYYRLYITYTLAGFLFDIDQSNICRDIQKIENLIRECVPIPQKIFKKTKRLRNPEEVEQYFPGFLAFIDCTQNNRFQGLLTRITERCTIQAKRKEKTHCCKESDNG